MRQVISYSFFRHSASAYEQPEAGAGQGRFFVGFLPALLRAHASVWPDWEMCIHHDERVLDYPYWPVVRFLELETPLMIRTMYCGDSQRLCESMLWRMKPIWRLDEYEVVLCRDIDALETPRSRKAVERWLETDKPVHVIHDSPSHAGVMGGTCGFRADYVRKRISWKTWQDCIKIADLSRHGSDQHFLTRQFGAMPRHVDDTASLGLLIDPRDKCGGDARCVGGAYRAGPVARWYDENYPEDTAIVREAERAVGI